MEGCLEVERGRGLHEKGTVMEDFHVVKVWRKRRLGDVLREILGE